MLPQRRDSLLRLVTAVVFGASVMLLVMTTLEAPTTVQSTRGAPVASRQVRAINSDISKLSLSEVTSRLAHVLSSPNQRPRSCLSTIYPGGSCSCDDIPGEDTCEMTPSLAGKLPVCLGPGHLLPGRPCLVYSVGVQAEMSFETELARLGCTVHVFDPLVHVNTSVVPEHVHVHALGVAGVSRVVSVGDRQLRVLTLDDLVRQMGHQRQHIDYLRLSAPGEWGVLQQQLDGGAALRDIPQLAVTLHLRYPRGIFDRAISEGELPSKQDMSNFLQRVNALQEAGFQLEWSRAGKAKFDGSSLSQEYHTFWVRA